MPRGPGTAARGWQLAAAARRVGWLVALWSTALIAQAAPGLGPAQPFSIDTIRDAERARQALTATAAARLEFREEWDKKRYECHQRIAVNRCLSQVNAERRDIEGRLTAIEIHARQVVRHSRLVDRNAAEANQQPSARTAESPAVTRAERAPPAAPKVPDESGAQQRAQRLSEQQQRVARHRSRLEENQLATRRELERRRTRQAELERKQREHAQKIEQGKANAAVFAERQKRAEERQKELERKRAATRPAGP